MGLRSKEIWRQEGSLMVLNLNLEEGFLMNLVDGWWDIWLVFLSLPDLFSGLPFLLFFPHSACCYCSLRSPSSSSSSIQTQARCSRCSRRSTFFLSLSLSGGFKFSSFFIPSASKGTANWRENGENWRELLQHQYYWYYHHGTSRKNWINLQKRRHRDICCCG